MALEDVTKEEHSRLGRIINPALVGGGIVIAGTLAILAYSILTNRDLPKQIWNMVSGNQKTEQYAPVSPPIVFTPAPKIDSLTVIRAYQPDLAVIIEGQNWFKDGLDTREQASLSKVTNYLLLDTGYLPDKLILNGAEKDIVILYDKGLESRAQEAATYLKTALPRSQEFFGLPVRWSIVFLRLNQLEEGRGSGGGASGGIASIDIFRSDWSGLDETIGHEGGGHTILDQDAKGSPIWYNESMAEIGSYVFSSDNYNLVLEDLLNMLEETRPSRKLRFSKPLAEFTIEDHIGKTATVEHITRGLDLLLSYRRIVGHDYFKQFVSDVDSIKRSRELTNEDIREKMLLHIPDEFKTEVATMYDAEVYGK